MPPRGPNSFNFMQFLGNFGKIICWHPPRELVPPPRGNPGFATVVYAMLFVNTVNMKIKACNALNAMFVDTVNIGVHYLI